MALRALTGAAFVWSAALLLAVSLGGCSGGSAKSCTSSDQCPAGSLCLAGTCQRPLTLTLVSPADMTYARGTVTVEASVANGNVSTMEIVVDGQVIASMSSPFTYELDVAARLSEGTHELKVRAAAGAQTYESETHTLIADFTPPTLVGWTPPAPARDVWLPDGVTLIFGEAVTPASIQSSIQCTWNGTALPCNATASSDGTRHVVSPDLTGLPLGVGALGISLTGAISDLAGNELAPGATWSGSVPVWQLPGGSGVASIRSRWDHTAPYAVLDANGLPFVVYTMTDPSEEYGDQLQAVARFDGARWSIVGTPFRGEYESSIALDASGNPFVATVNGMRGNEGAGALEVWQWDGSAWTRLGESLLRAGGRVAFPNIRVDPNGRPVVAWREDDDAYVSRWTGSEWLPLGGALNTAAVGQSSNFPSVALVLDAAGNPIVSWAEGTWVLRRWDTSGGAWSATIEAPTTSGSCVPHSLTLDAQGLPSMVCTRTESASYFAQVFHLESWTQLQWQASPDLSIGALDFVCGLAVDDAGVPTIGWMSSTTFPGTAFATRLADGQYWRTLGDIITAEQLGESGHFQRYGNFVGGPDGTMALAFETSTNGSDIYQVWLKRFNR
jgi:hypothetical protein